MRPLLMVTFCLLGVAGNSSAEEGTKPRPAGKRIDFSCDLELYKPTPIEPLTKKLLNDFNRMPGTGRLIREWRIVQTYEHAYTISGTIVNDNSGFPAENAAIFLGNLEVDDKIRLMARTNEKGEFTFYVSNQTSEQVRKQIEASGLTVFFTNNGKKPRTQEEIYASHKFLYTGQSNSDLYRYEIPYDQAEREAKKQDAKERVEK